MWIRLYMTWLWNLCFLWVFLLGFFHSPQISVKLLVHKIESPQEWEALQALTVCIDLIFLLFFLPLCIAPKCQIWIYASSLQVLEACMKNCGRRFHSEVGQFRFLNELVKVISPKVGNKSASTDLRSSACIGVECHWNVGLHLLSLFSI